MSCFATCTMLIGMAKPMPSLPPELLAMAVLMPMTSPRRLTSGPPLLPGLMAASVWRKSWKRTPSSPKLQIAAALGADDAVGDRMAQPEGAAHGQHEIADLHAVAVAQASATRSGWRRSPSRRRRCPRPPNLRGVESPAVGQVDLDASVAEPANDVPVGQHVVPGRRWMITPEPASSTRRPDDVQRSSVGLSRLDIARPGRRTRVTTCSRIRPSRSRWHRRRVPALRRADRDRSTRRPGQTAERTRYRSGEAVRPRHETVASDAIATAQRSARSGLPAPLGLDVTNQAPPKANAAVPVRERRSPGR